MPTTPNGLRYPAASDPPNGPLQIGNLAADVDTKITTLTNARGGHLLTKTQTAAASASSTSRVALPGVSGSVLLPSSRRIVVHLSASRCSGSSGAELGRLILRINTAEVRDAQWRNSVSGALGEVGASMTWSTTLAAGTHSFDAQILRVIGGSQVTVSGGHLVVLDEGAA